MTGKAELIPAVLEQSRENLTTILQSLVGLVSRVQIDFADQSLVANHTVLPADLDRLSNDFELDAHLMVNQPMSYFTDLVRLGFKRVIVHVEAIDRPAAIIVAAKAHQLDLAVTLKPETAISALEPYRDACQFIQVMAIDPGFGNQPFLATTYERLDQIIMAFPHLPLAVDGGVRLDNARLLIEHGARLLVVGRAGFMADGDPTPGIDRWHALLSSQ